MYALVLALLGFQDSYELLVVSGEACLPCKQMAPTIQQIEQSGVKVHHVDWERQNSIARAWGVQVMPTMLVIRNQDGKYSEYRRFTGLTDYQTLLSAIPKPIPAAELPQKDLAEWWLSNRLSVVPNVAAPQKAKPDSAMQSLALACHVRVKVETTREIAWGSGTIFHYKDNRSEIITNKHVVASGGTITIDDGTDYWSGVKCSEVWPGRGYFGSDDIAVIIAEKRPPAIAAICDIGYVPKEPLYMVGSPHGEAPVICQTHIVKRWTSSKGESNLSLNVQPVSGDSGAALYDSAGLIIGVIWGYDPAGPGFAVDLTRSQVILEATRKKSQKSAGN